MKPAVLDWLYENELRSYPIRDSSIRTDGSFVLADDVIIDAQFVFETLPTNFRLTEIVKGSTITFNFSNGLSIESAVNSDVTRIRHEDGHLLVLGKGVENIPNGTYTLDVFFEPSIIIEYGGSWKGVSSLQFDDGSAYTGELKFLEGYQFDLSIVNQNIALAVGNLYGTPVACEHFGTSPENCDTIISFISTTTPAGNGSVLLKGGPGIVVWDDPPNNRIYVGFAFTSIKDVCGDIPPFPIN